MAHSAVRDLEQIREKTDDYAPRRFALVGLAIASVIGLCGALLVTLSSSHQQPEIADDPLSGLQNPKAVSPEPARGAPNLPTVQQEGLYFPDLLDDQAASPNPETTVASAAAELAHPDPLGEESIEAQLPAEDADSANAKPALPAVVAASTNQLLERAARRDPMVRAALPKSSRGELAPVGSEGPFTIQVISYEQAFRAHEFAKSLRARGHKAYVMRADLGDRGTHFRVRIGPFGSRAEAEEYRSKFERDENMNTLVVRKVESQDSDNA